jgi:hypothetical protein
MPSTIAAVPPSSYIPPDAERNAGWDVPEYAFSELWQDRKEGLSFGDLLDIINPLQHIPVVSSVYRMITGDEIGVGARLAGGALFGGPFGALAAGAVAAFEGASGKSVDQHVAALFEDAPEDAPAAPQIAEATPAVTSQMAATGAPVAIAMASPPAPAKPAPEPGPPAPDQRATAKAPPQPAPDAAAERRRVAQAIEQAQRAQAWLLLASIEADRTATRQAGDGSDADDADAGPAQPFRQHPYMLPPGAPPQLISRAMEQALLRYQSMLQQRETGAPAAAPRAAPAPVR